MPLLPLLAAVTALQYPLGLAAAAQLLELSGQPLRRSAVRAAYRKKAATSHPDVSSAPNAQSHFLCITAAYETLLQFSVADIEGPAHPCPSSGSVSTHHSATECEATAGSPWSSAPPQAATACHSERFEHRVAGWRLYWQASFQAAQASAEAERKALQVSALAREKEVLRAKLAAFPTHGRSTDSTLDAQRARYAAASSRHADAQCALETLRARVRMLHEEAAHLQMSAQGSEAPYYGI
jgi:hypothetical protein